MPDGWNENLLGRHPRFILLVMKGSQDMIFIATTQCQLINTPCPIVIVFIRRRYPFQVLSEHANRE